MAARGIATDVQHRIAQLAPDQLAVLAHELRIPLATMHAALELLTDFRALEPEDVMHLLSRLSRGLSWLATLIENLGAWSALMSGHLRLQRASVAVDDCVESALALVQPFLERKHQSVRRIRSAPGAKVYADAQRLVEVLVNLLTNASAYGPWQDEIELEIGSSGDWTWVRVTDHGPGIAP